MTTTNNAGRQPTSTPRTPAARGWSDRAAPAAEGAGGPPEAEASPVANGDGSGRPNPVMTPMTKWSTAELH